MKKALQFSIKVYRQDIAFDLIAFSVEKNVALTVTEKTIQILLKNEMFTLIEDLI